MILKLLRHFITGYIWNIYVLLFSKISVIINIIFCFEHECVCVCVCVCGHVCVTVREREREIFKFWSLSKMTTSVVCMFVWLGGWVCACTSLTTCKIASKLQLPALFEENKASSSPLHFRVITADVCGDSLCFFSCWLSTTLPVAWPV